LVGENEAGYIIYKDKDGHMYSVNAEGMYVPPPAEFQTIDKGRVTLSNKGKGYILKHGDDLHRYVQLFDVDDEGMKNLMPILLDAQIYVESRGNENAVSKAGAKGVAQIMQVAQKDMEMQGLIKPELDRSDTANNLLMQYVYMTKRLPQFQAVRTAKDNKDRVLKLLASYNAGPGTVMNAIKKAEKKGTNWFDELPSETKAYIPLVLKKANELSLQKNYTSPYERKFME
jgi:membrane-bound lytic murein transglycosylase MltF